MQKYDDFSLFNVQEVNDSVFTPFQIIGGVE